ncbi:MAG: N-acetyl-gamma-glutamyl-phosphate reductase [Ardenticatenaceae bacterium]|nr:N-acetyl-gamma-glutamyl-phosphate reductase [Ardenticatenaceae bacterium]
MIRAGIFGATGYTGYELVKILCKHPQAAIVFATSQSNAGQTLDAIYPQAPRLPLISGEEAPLDQVDVVFLCLPHAAAAETAVSALHAGVKVIDLSADFRIKDVAVYEKWYKVTHPAPELLAEAVYGLTEFARDALPPTRLVANPGCYTTTSLLALQPIVAAGVPIAGDIIIDAKSGVSGAGRNPAANTHFMAVTDNLSPYKIGRAHRHLPEMEAIVREWNPAAPNLIFSPHLLPVPRGILANVYVPLAETWTEADLRQLYRDTYEGEPFVHMLPQGELASLAHVTYTNRCAISLTLAGNMLILTSATDNLIKGASGQAVQNMNVLFGLEETAGLI